MSFQDNFFLGFELFSRFYALPISTVYQIFHQESSDQQSHILKIDEMVVFEGEPFYLAKPNKLLPTYFSLGDEVNGTQNQESSLVKSKMPWVIVLKNEDKKSSKKGLGFRVQQIVSPFELDLAKSDASHNNYFYAGKEYQVILI
jgi:hypothetical protein